MSGKTNRVWWLAYALLVVANLFDAISTHIVIAGRGATELNPIMNYVIHEWGWEGFFIVKVLIVIPMAFLVPRISPAGKLMLSGAVILYLLLTAWHILGRIILIYWT